MHKKRKYTVCAEEIKSVRNVFFHNKSLVKERKFVFANQRLDRTVLMC